jgi:ATP-binding cassette subfamily B protein
MSIDETPVPDLSARPVPTMRAGWRVGTFRRGLWARSWVTWLAFYMTPLATGWFLKQVFDALESGENVRGWLLAIGVTEGARMVLFAVAIWFVVRWWVGGLTTLRTNMLHAQTVSGGPARGSLPAGPAEAISRFHDDARDAVIWSDSWLDGFGNIAFGASALLVMATISLRAALIVLIPIAIVTLVIGWIRPRLYAASEADREATGTVNAFLGETFAGMLAFRLAAREPAVVARLERHTEARRKTAVRHVVLEQSLDGLTSTTADASTGLILLVLVPSVRRGEISVGDMALFVTYIETLGNVPRYLSRLVTAREQAKVSLRRMGELVAPGRFDDLLASRPIDIDRGDDPVLRSADPARNELMHLEITGLTARHPSTGGGVSDIDLTIDGGEFVVITGAVGSGKSTLLRSLAGLVERQGGTVRWNGETIEDLGAWFVPPNVAHLPQVPRLFSESLADNITLGRSADLLDEVIDVTTLRTDLDEMPDGVETKVGARGLRLSGGQAQRVATARSLLTNPELLLVDDLSSALDVETERSLWSHVRARGTTVLAVSHRQFVLDMADRVITLDDGYVVDGST